jgi:hypothetical protein
VNTRHLNHFILPPTAQPCRHIPQPRSQKRCTPPTRQPLHTRVELEHRLFLGCFGGREVVSLQGQGNEAGGLVEEIYSGACCAALDGSLFVLVLAHQDQLVWFDGERGRVIFSWSVGFESQNFGKYINNPCPRHISDNASQETRSQQAPAVAPGKRRANTLQTPRIPQV